MTAHGTLPPQPEPPTTLAVAVDVGAGYLGDIDGHHVDYGLSSHAAAEALVGIGWRRGKHTYLLRALVDEAPAALGQGTVRAAAIGPSYVSWDRLPLVDIPLELEIGAGIGGFERPGEHVHHGLDVFWGAGVPLSHAHDVLLAVRLSNLHSYSNFLSLWLPPFGDQQTMMFSVSLSWRPR